VSHSNGWLAAVVILGFVVVAITYAPEVKAALDHTWTGGLLSNRVNRSTSIGSSLAWIGKELDLPAFSYLRGLSMAAERSTSGGGTTYVLGHVYEQGQWWYFPVAFAVKTPVGVLALSLLSGLVAVVAIARLRRGLPFPIVVLAVPPALFFALSMIAKLNIGLRHILPIYPFLDVLIAYTVVRHGRLLLKPYIAPLLLGIAVAESAFAYPYYLSFFNRLVGGPDTGPRYLVDSNIDWGQDVKRLKRFMDANHLNVVCADIFGNAPLPYYGIEMLGLPADPNDVGAIENLDCVVAVSVTLVGGLYVVEPNHYKWLWKWPIAGKIAYSIDIYDRRKHPDSVLRFH
jgi:hypothetical protein